MIVNCNICGLFTLTASDIGSDDDTEFRKYMCFKPILPNVVLCLNAKATSLVDRGLGKSNFLCIFSRIKENFALSFPFAEFILSDCESRMTNGKFLIDSPIQH